MNMHEKILKAKSTEWLTEGLSKPEIKSNIELAKISARLEMKRIDLGMTQKQFAEYMGVSQGMVSKWESREYNFTIATLNDICEKLGLIFDPIIREE
ncbi:MAG: helix-turn-helix domain-containing protein [Lachnospiraceae bacterium]|nr:helix-turn-helix domain-containing protein [Lachnospiraceae bacterium]